MRLRKHAIAATFDFSVGKHTHPINIGSCEHSVPCPRRKKWNINYLIVWGNNTYQCRKKLETESERQRKREGRERREKRERVRGAREREKGGGVR